MKRLDHKSDCPINYSLESFGDPWSLLIVRDIVYFGKRTYGEFLASEERVATNVLASRLADLEKRGILHKEDHPHDKRREVYSLTEQGLELIPLLLCAAQWGAQAGCGMGLPRTWLDYVAAHREEAIRIVSNTVRAGGAIFAGPNNVIGQLGIILSP